jgi:hypothetical protein
MPEKDDNPRDEVGYKKPPRNSQFQRGRSGNPSGRPKGALNLETILKRNLNAKVVINENGVRKKVTKLEAAMMQLANKSATGDSTATRQLLTVLSVAQCKLGKTSVVNGDPDPDPFGIRNAALCRRAARVVKKLFGLAEDEEGPILVLTEIQAEELVLKLRKIYGLPLNTDEAIKLANTGFGILDAEEDPKSTK